MDFFDIIFGAFTAFNQIGFLFGGGVCLIIALAMLGYPLYWFLKGQRVAARVVGVRARGIKDPEREVDSAQTEEAVKPVLEEAGTSFKQQFFKAPVNTFFASIIVMMFLLVPFAFFGFGAYVAYNFVDLKVRGIEVSATIADIESQRSDDGTSYYAVVSYTDHNGDYHRERDNIGTGGSSSYAVGEKVTVFYAADNPEHFIIDDFWHYMGLAIAFMIMPLVFIAIMVAANNSGKKSTRKRGDNSKKIRARDYTAEMYYPVYEFKMPNGELARVNDESGSNMLSASRIGKQVTLYLKDGTAQSAHRPSMLIFFMGLIFLIPGVLFTYLAVTTFEFTVMTPIMFLGLLVWGAFKAKKSGAIKPREMWESRHQFKIRMNEKKEKKLAKGRLLTADEIKNRLVVHDRQLMRSLPVWGVIAVLMFVGGYELYGNMAEKIASGLHAQGKIVRIESEYDSSSDGGGYTYYGVVEYRTDAGREIEFRDNVGSSSALFKRGDAVDVLYDPAKPQKAMINRGIWNWAPSIGLMLIGALLNIWALRTFFSIRARQNKF